MAIKQSGGLMDAAGLPASLHVLPTTRSVILLSVACG